MRGVIFIIDLNYIKYYNHTEGNSCTVGITDVGVPQESFIADLMTTCNCALFQPFPTLSTSIFPVPCCPNDVTVSLVSTETLEITWTAVNGAELYETTAAESWKTIHCNDTAPVCALSDLNCNTAYSVIVTPCSEIRGCNNTCTAQTHETGKMASCIRAAGI